MPGSLMGTAVRRVEDPDLVRGISTYVDNLRLEGTLFAAFVRSPVAHGTLGAIDGTEAAAAPGVVAVYTADDLGLPPHHQFFALNEKTPQPPLAVGKVRYVGEPVALVVAGTRAQAADGASLVDVDIDPLPAEVDPEEALRDGASLQFEELGSNIAAGMREPDGSDPLGDAEVVVRGRFVNQRVHIAPMEGNAIVAVPGENGADHELTVHVSTQMPHAMAMLIGATFGMDPTKVRVIAPHVGGGFGGKAGLPQDYTVIIGAARKLGRPVGWAETRSENLTSMNQGRDQIQYIELGLRRDGSITGLRARVVADSGAYAGYGGALALGPTYLMSQGVYEIPKIGYDAVAVMTNKTGLGAFRGAGRPEAAAFLERIMDLAADELDIDPAEIRRRNLIAPDRFPYPTISGATYDIGDYERALDEVLRVADYEGLRAEQARRRASGDRMQLGIGLAVYVEVTAPTGMTGDFGAVEVHEDGSATIRVGTSAHGQGHATSFAMLVSDTLDIPMESIKFVQSDTAKIPTGGGTGGSRSLQVGGSAVLGAAGEVLVKAKELAASMLEASVDDIELREGTLGVSGVPGKELGWTELGAAAAERGERLSAEHNFDQGSSTFPFGAHLAVVEVDTETGRVTPQRLYLVDDCGKVLNPLIVEGQVHGGAAQGIAQALWEHVEFDEDGNPLSGTFADYGIPCAADMPPLDAVSIETPTPVNPLGAKGIGESGAVGSTPAVQNAVVDAISHLGVRHIDLPCSSQRVWRAIRSAQAGEDQNPWREPPAAFASLPPRPSGDNEMDAATI